MPNIVDLVRCVALGSGLIILGACAHPGDQRLRMYIDSEDYARIAPGPKRVDALYSQARMIAGSDPQALALLGAVACHDGARLKHPFNTGLTTTGSLATTDKTTHFFAYAWWQYQDRRSLIHTAKTKAYFWEVLGEIRSWFTPSAGFDRSDLHAGRLGGQFALLITTTPTPDPDIMPSTVLNEIQGKH